MVKDEEWDFNPFADPEVDLSTPAEQQTSEPLVYANLWHRFVAAFVDGLSMMNATFIIVLPLWDIFGLPPGKGNLWMVIILLSRIIGWLYFAQQESSEAQATFGEKAMRLKVVGLSGERISFGRATGRYCGRHIFLLIWLLGYGQISLLVFFLGYLMQPFTKKRQALHDLIAGTLVIKY